MKYLLLQMPRSWVLRAPELILLLCCRRRTTTASTAHWSSNCALPCLFDAIIVASFSVLVYP